MAERLIPDDFCTGDGTGVEGFDDDEDDDRCVIVTSYKKKINYLFK